MFLNREAGEWFGVGLLERPDIEAHIGRDHYVIDVMVPHPTAKSNVVSATAPLGVAKKEEIKNCKKHKRFAENRGASMIAYIVESYGGMGKQARSFNKTVANYAARTSSVYGRDELLQSIYAAVSVEVQEGNRVIVETAIQQCTKLRRPTCPTEDVVIHAETLCIRPPEITGWVG